MDPVVDYDGWYALRYGIGQTLTRVNDDLSISGWLVTDDYYSSDDFTEWTFTLRDDVTFSNGTRLTADLAKASIENVFANGQRGPEYFTPTEITAEGSRLTIKTADPEPIMPNKLADPLFTVIDTSADNSDISANGPVCTGPFVVDSYDPVSRECVVVKNEHYWGGAVSLDRIRFVYTEDQSALTMALQSGEFDAVYNLSMNDIGAFESSPDFTVEKDTGGRTTIGFMNQNGQLGDIVLREAVLRSLDRETYCRHLLMDQYTPGRTLLTSAADYGYGELKDPNAFDPESAAALLDEAGYKDMDGDGFREDPDGRPVNLDYVYYTGRPEQQILVEATQASLAEIGIRVTPDVQDTAVVMDRQKSGDYDLLCMSINMMNCGDPENQINTYFCDDGTYNASGYDSADFNDLMDKVSVTADPDERKDLVKQAEQILLNDAAVIPYCYPVINFVMKKNVTNICAAPADFYWVDENTDIS
jgi:peptide/nickel transport system substrate-binding protein